MESTYDIKQAAAYLGCSVYNTLRNLFKKQTIAAAKIGKSYTFRQSELDRLRQNAEQCTAQTAQQRTTSCQSINATDAGISIFKRQAAKELDNLLAQKPKSITTKSNTNSGGKSVSVKNPSSLGMKPH